MTHRDFEAVLKHLTIDTPLLNDTQKAFIRDFKAYCDNVGDILSDTGYYFCKIFPQYGNQGMLTTHWPELVKFGYHWKLLQSLRVSSPTSDASTPTISQFWDAYNRTSHEIKRLGPKVASDIMGSWYVRLIGSKVV